jgi:hypothetical protein
MDARKEAPLGMKRPSRLAWLVGLGLLSTALIPAFGGGQGLAQETPTPAGTPGEPFCYTNRPGIKMNTVTADRFVKTIKVEKEVFACDDDGDGPIDRIIDIQIFTEIIERIRTDPTDPKINQFPTEKIRFEVVKCTKRTNPANVNCTHGYPAQTVPDGLKCQVGAENNVVISGGPSGGDLIDMNTVRVGDIIKTVKGQTELFSCEDPDDPTRHVIAELETFTEIFERVGQDGIFPVAKTVQPVLCIKDVQQTGDEPFGVRVRSCGVIDRQVLLGD